MQPWQVHGHAPGPPWCAAAALDRGRRPLTAAASRRRPTHASPFPPAPGGAAARIAPPPPEPPAAQYPYWPGVSPAPKTPPAPVGSKGSLAAGRLPDVRLAASARCSANPERGPTARRGAQDRDNSPATRVRPRASSGTPKPEAAELAGVKLEMGRRRRRRQTSCADPAGPAFAAGRSPAVAALSAPTN